ncbi:FkbM family methyltransferase [Xanthomonas sp. 10-10]|uniref:FkbM family methyltransferase n=1 Tax=Xanthomonas sp. 10-10 TaxID=3115848 RepID=A0AAU7PDP3_9XANT
MMAYQAGRCDDTLSAYAHAHAAMLLLKQGLVGRAQRRLTQAIALEPENPQWHLELARVLRDAAPQEAADSYVTAHRLGSNNAPLEAACLLQPQSVEQVAPLTLWTSDRLDIAAKLQFAQHYLGHSSAKTIDAVGIYRQHIQQRTAGREPDALGKCCVADYELAFAKLIEDMRERGFQDHCAIPLDGDGRLLNGAHRLAAALALGLSTVAVVRLPPQWRAVDWSMSWFLHNGFAPQQINALLSTWLQWHAQTGRFVVIEHHADEQAMKLTLALAQQFGCVAWREVPASLCTALSGTIVAPAALRYILLEAEDQALQTFVAQHNNAYPALRCQALPAQANTRAADLVLDEENLALAHGSLLPADASKGTLGQWIGYRQVPMQCTAATASGFMKWRNLQLLETVHTIIDVGVAEGTPDLYRNLSPAHVIFIEPVTLFAAQVETLRQQFPSSQYLQIGLSDRKEQTVINYREDAPVLSSLLESSSLRDTGAERIIRLPVELHRLDDVFAQLHETDRTTLLKIDTEGYELQILRGAVESLRKMTYVMLELSVIERFHGSYTCQELVSFMQQQGFQLHTCLSASVDAQGYCRVVDAVFINTVASQRTLVANV